MSRLKDGPTFPPLKLSPQGTQANPLTVRGLMVSRSSSHDCVLRKLGEAGMDEVHFAEAPFKRTSFLPAVLVGRNLKGENMKKLLLVICCLLILVVLVAPGLRRAKAVAVT